MTVSFVLPQIGGQMTVMNSRYEWMGLWYQSWFIVCVVGGLLKMLKSWRGEGQFDDTRFARTLLVRDEVAGDHESFFIPPPDFLNDIFGYNFDEGMLLGDKAAAAKWPLLEYLKSKMSNLVSQMLDVILEKEKETKDDDAAENDDEEEVKEEEEEPEEPVTNRIGRDLPSTYAEFVKILAISLTFGLVSPMIGFVAAIGICCRSFTLAYFVHIWELRQEKGEIEFRKTDAQGIPIRCIMLVVFFVLGFFVTPALITGYHNRDEKGNSGEVVTALVASSFFLLFSQVVVMMFKSAKNQEKIDFNNDNKAVSLLEQT